MQQTISAPQSHSIDAAPPKRWRRLGIKSRRLTHAAFGTGLFACAVVLPLLRQAGPRPWQGLWAEDGALYLSESNIDGVSVVFRPYMGYLQLVSRLVMAPAPLFPLNRVPLYVALASSIFMAGLAALVFRWTWGWISSTGLRLLVAAMYVLSPALLWEGTGNATNLIWPLMGVVPWALLSRRTTRGDLVGRVIVVTLAPLSHVLAFTFFPLAIAVAWRRRTRATFVLAGAMLIGVAVQLNFMRSSARLPAGSNAIGEVLTTASLNLFGTVLIGDINLRDAWVRFGVGAALLFTFVVFAIFAVVARRASSRSRLIALLFTCYALLLMVGPIVANGSERVAPIAGEIPGPIERYTLVPGILLITALVILVDSPDRSRHRTTARVGRVLLASQVVLLSLICFRADNARSFSPLWFDELVQAHESCESGAVSANLAIAPPGWFTTVTCTDVALAFDK